MSEPVAAQEAEARYVIRYRDDDPWPCHELVDTVTGSVLVDDGGAPEDRNLYRDFAPLVAELNRVAQLLASERERYAALVEAAREIRPLQATGPEWWRCAICGHKERQLTRDPAAMHDANCAWLALSTALAALEEAGSA